MTFTDICIITTDVLRVVDFYEMIFNTKANGDNVHSFVKVAGLSIAIYDREKAEKEMGLDLSTAGNGLITIGFNVDDVDIEYERVKSLGVKSVTEPHLWPWGAKSFNFKDVDGNLIFFRSWPKKRY